ncbi:hypothetical protein [Bacillus sp. JZ34]
MDWLTNTWVVSLISAIVSTVFVDGLRKFIGRKEYLKRVKKANEVMIHTLKNLISEGEKPSIHLIDSLVSAYAKSFKIKVNSMYSISEILDHLIKEIFETNFISIDQKMVISNNLLELKKVYLKEKDEFAPIETEFGTITFDKGIKQLKEMQKIKRNLAVFSVIFICFLTVYLAIMTHPELRKILQDNLQLIKNISVLLIAIGFVTLILKIGFSKPK